MRALATGSEIGPVGILVAIEERGYFGGRISRPEVAALLAVAAVDRNLARTVEILVARQQRRAERAPGVARGGLDPHPVEDALAKHLAIGHAIQRNSAGHDQVLFCRSARAVARQPQHGFFGHLLDGSRHIHFAPSDARFRRSGGPSNNSSNRSLVITKPLEIFEIFHVQPVGAVILEIDQFCPDTIGVVRLPIGREAH